MIEKLLALAPKTANCKLHFFVPFNFRAYSFLPVLQILIKFSNTSTCKYSNYSQKIQIIGTKAQNPQNLLCQLSQKSQNPANLHSLQAIFV